MMNIPFLQNATFTGLVSTDEYRTSNEWNQAYDLSQNVYTHVQTSSGDWQYAYNIATFYSQNSAILIEQTTFTELTSLKANNQLKPGQFYLINDFELKWKRFGGEPRFVSSGVIEPLLVLALSTNKINAEAYSILHPDDIVYYDVDAKTSYSWTSFAPIAESEPVPGIKGWITRRINRTLNIDIGWDWRYITNTCCKYDLTPIPTYSNSVVYGIGDFVKTTQGKIYLSIRNTNLNNLLTNLTWWLPTSPSIEGNMYFPTNFTGEGGLNIPGYSLSPILSTRAELPTFTGSFETSGVYLSINSFNVRNVKIISGVNNIMNYCINNTIENDFRNNVIRIITGTGFFGNEVKTNFSSNNIFTQFENNFIGSNFNKNLVGNYTATGVVGTNNSAFGDNFTNNVITHIFRNNTFNNSCQNNIFANNFTFNKIGNSFSNNKIGSFFSNNLIADNFSTNIINTNFIDNNIGSVFQNNTIGSNFTFNSFGNSCTNNIIGNFCSYNNIRNNFSSNTIGTDFQSNSIENYFSNNTIGNIFEYNNIGNDFQLNTTSSNFVRTNIGNAIQNINFTGATHVYNSYDKNIFKNFDSIARLSYFNTNDQLVVTDPTA